MKYSFTEALVIAAPCLKIVSGPGSPPDHITYKPELGWWHGDYQIIRSMQYDGTLIFESELMAQVLLPVLNKQSCHKKDKGKRFTDIRYEVGPVRITEKACSFGSVKNGIEQTAKMWVKTYPCHEPPRQD